MEVTFWEKPVDELSYYEKLRRGICPECNYPRTLIVEVGYEYVRQPQAKMVDGIPDVGNMRMVDVKQYHTVIRCKQCAEPYLPTQLLPMGERFT